MLINSFAIALMLVIASNKSQEIALAASFLILLESIKALNDAFDVIYYNWLMIIYAYISIVAYYLARKLLFVSDKAYIFYICAYFIFALENTLYEFDVIMGYGFFDENYITIMCACLAILVLAVIHDKLSTCKLRDVGANNNLLEYRAAATVNSQGRL
jgi:hypothetical protein